MTAAEQLAELGVELRYAAVRYAQAKMAVLGWTQIGDRTYTRDGVRAYVPDIDVERGALDGVDKTLQYYLYSANGITAQDVAETMPEDVR